MLGAAGFKVIDDKYLLELLKKGELSGYIVENEHIKGFLILSGVKENIFIPGANAYFTNNANEHYTRIWVDTIISCINGKPINVVN